MASRNKKYEGVLNPRTEVIAKKMIAFGFKIDIEPCARTFETNVHVVRSCIKEEGLKSAAFGPQYDILFGKNAWHKGNEICDTHEFWRNASRFVESGGCMPQGMSQALVMCCAFTVHWLPSLA